MPVSLPQLSRQTACDAITARVGTGGLLSIYSGAEPSSDAPASGLLAQLAMSDPAFGAADANGLATANPITDDSAADASGTATYFRIETSGGVIVYQGDVGVTGSGATLELNTVNIIAGATVSVTSLTLQVPEAQA